MMKTIIETDHSYTFHMLLDVVLLDCLGQAGHRLEELVQKVQHVGEAVAENATETAQHIDARSAQPLERDRIKPHDTTRGLPQWL